MSSGELREVLEREPFQPFRILLSSGESHDVRNPRFVIAMHTKMFVVKPGTNRYTLIPFLHIAAVETLSNGASRRRRRKHD